MTWRSSLARALGLALGGFIGWWSQAVLRASGGFLVLHTLGAEGRETVSSATHGIVSPRGPPQMGEVFGEVGRAFGVLGILIAVVLIVASLFPYEWWRRRRAA